MKIIRYQNSKSSENYYLRDPSKSDYSSDLLVFLPYFTLILSSGLEPFNPTPMLQPTPYLGTSLCLACRNGKGSRSVAHGLSSQSACWAKSNLVLHIRARMPAWFMYMPQPYGIILETGKLGLCLNFFIHHKLKMNVYHLSVSLLPIINTYILSTCIC